MNRQSGYGRIPFFKFQVISKIGLVIASLFSINNNSHKGKYLMAISGMEVPYNYNLNFDFSACDLLLVNSF